MLEILKVIGIILLCLLAVCVVLFLLAAFFPVRYQLMAKGKNEDIKAEAHGVWLFGAASFKGRYEDKDLTYRFAVCGITVKKGKLENLDELVKTAWNETTESGKQGAGEAKDANNESIKAEETVQPGKQGAGEEKYTKEEGTRINKTYQKEPEPLAERIRLKIEEIKKIIDKASRIKHILNTRSGRRVTGFVKQQLKKLLPKIKPRHICGWISYGFKDAASTAVLYGIASHYAYLVSDGELEIIPDFTEEGVELDVVAKGRFQAGPVLKIIFDTISDEGVKKAFRVIQKIIQS